MKKIAQISLIVFLLFACKDRSDKPTETTSQKLPFAIVLHGGAGYITPDTFSPEREKLYRNKLKEALYAGYEVLEKGGTSLDAIGKTITLLEDSPLFNAGKGAVFNNEGKNELDASIMDGHTLNAGAVAGVCRIKNPIQAARMVMDSSRHLLFSGRGAELFAEQKGIEMVPENYFFTQTQYDRLLQVQQKEQEKHTDIPFQNKIHRDKKYGTVGAVALDKQGNIAAGTSTGGLTNKKYGRIGDSPIIGAGTYANNATCGISATGTGEYFIRTLAAHETSALIQHKELPLKEALVRVIEQIGNLGGDGGMIGLDQKGNIAWYFNTPGMFRAYKKSDGKEVIAFYEERDSE